MKLLSLVFVVALCGAVARAGADQAPEKAKPAPQITQATYLITGLHCPPCARTIERSLGRTKGIRSIKVDYSGKLARLEFDESVISAQKIAELIAGTPHMMGRGMHYGGWLALRVTGLDAKGADRAKAALEHVKGVKRVAVYPAQKSVVISFEDKGSVSGRDLIEALGAVDVKATF